MKSLTLLSLLILGLNCQVRGEVCYTCTDLDYNGEDGYTGNCFTTVASGSGKTDNETCLLDVAGVVTYYCRTKFTLNDGVVTSVTRGCIASTADEDFYQITVPANDKCVTTIDSSGNPTDRTECNYHCTSDLCNNVTTTSLTACSTDCNIGNGGGSCNYIAGTCVCNAGFSGSNCTRHAATSITTPCAPRSCVQCNSLVDSGCTSSTASVACPGIETYCSTATSTIYNSSYAVIRSVTTRGCASSFTAVDECSFTNIYSDPPISDSSVGYNEFTCYSTCDTDGCNTGTADGFLNGNEAVLLQCVQCSDTTGSGVCDRYTTRTPCASSSTHCKTTVTYLISDHSDLSYAGANPEYKLVSNVRECASAAVTSQCITTRFGGLSPAKVTCTETCQTDGCNTGWPTRPKCLMCSSSSSTSGNGYDKCAENPDEASDCVYPYQEYCYLVEEGIGKGTGKPVTGYPHRVIRGCSHINIGTGCKETTIRSTAIESCNRTCTTDGCNVGSGSNMPLQTIIALLAPLIAGLLEQHH